MRELLPQHSQAAALELSHQLGPTGSAVPSAYPPTCIPFKSRRVL